MVTEKQRANLAKGRVKGIKRGTPKEPNKTGELQTWRALIEAVGSLPITDEAGLAKLREMGVDKKFLAAIGMTQPTKKLLKVLIMYADNSPQMVKEMMQRSEPIEQAVRISGVVDVFNYASIDRLLENRSAGDSSESGDG
jgi:hypothetical protein